MDKENKANIFGKILGSLGLCTEYSGCVAVIYSTKTACKQITSIAHYAEVNDLCLPFDN